MTDEAEKDVWYGYECLSGDCAQRRSVVLYFRARGIKVPPAPTVLCPICGTPMHWDAQWEADERGFGSRGDMVVGDADGPEDGEVPISAEKATERALCVGLRLRALREVAGLTQTEVSKRSGIDRPNVCRIENERRDHRMSTVLRYLAAVGANYGGLEES